MIREGAFGCKSERNRLQLFFLLFLCDFACCLGLNSEGFALLRFKERVARDPFNALSSWNAGADDADPCSWFGVACSDGRVVALSLKDMSLRGTLPPELGRLAHVKSIILRNNSFYGTIPREIVALKELKMLDLGYNNIAGPLPFDLSKVFVGMLLLDNNNRLTDGVFTEQNESMLFGEQADEHKSSIASARDNCGDKLVGWSMDYLLYSVQRSLLQTSRDSKANEENDTKKLSVSSLVPSHPPISHAHRKSLPLPPQRLPHKPLTASSSKRLPAPSPLLSPRSSPSPSPSPSPFPSRKFLPPASAPTRSREAASSSKKIPTAAQAVSSHAASRPSPALVSRRKVGRSHAVLIGIFTAGGSLVIIASVFAIVLCRSNKMAAVKPWAASTGLSGQLQRALVSGVSKLKRSELETACEDFSNIIGTLEDSTVYKGTLSNGVEIAVVSSTAKSRKEWSKHLETQFRKKIETLSKVNHRNFVNLLGYCEEEKPFTRMMVFEYAPNGTLFEHLHVKEAERLDWRTRTRIITGVAYCLVHMHEQDPPTPHRDLQSSSIYLSQDYATKVSDFTFRTPTTPPKALRSPSFQLLEASSTADLESNVRSFGLLLLETITGKTPQAEDGAVEDWVWESLSGQVFSRDVVDPTLEEFDEEEVKRLFEIVKECVHPDPSERPRMIDVASGLRRAVGVEAERAAPRQSPLWWAELEISFGEDR